MTVKMRKVQKVGPFRFHYTLKGLSSWSIKIGPWSYNSRAERHRVDLPGPFHWQSDTRKGKTSGRV